MRHEHSAKEILIKQAQGLLYCHLVSQRCQPIIMHEEDNTFDDLLMLLDLSLVDHYYLD